MNFKLNVPDLMDIPEGAYSSAYPLWSKMQNIVADAKNQGEEPSAGDIAEFQGLEKAFYAITKAKVPSAGRKVTGDQPGYTASASRPSQKLSCFQSPKNALAFGKLLTGARGDAESLNWLNSNGYSAVHTEGVNAAGGYLVPDILSQDIIRLVNDFGVFRKNSYNRTMTSDTLNIPRRTGGLTSYFTGEATAISESTLTIDKVLLSAKKLAVLTRLSNELVEDSIIDIADFIATEIAWAFAEKEDQCGFNGDGTSTYGGMTGVITKLLDINGVDDGGGLVIAAGNEWSEITLADIMKVAAAPAGYARQRDCAWYCSSAFYAGVLVRIIAGAGGTTMSEVVNGVSQKKYLGWPIHLTEVMRTSQANSTIPLLFGSLSQATSFGDRRMISIEASPSAVIGGVDSFSADLLAIRGTERFDINVHDVGTATTAGGVVGLIMAAA